jgi:ribosome-associated heat shock protein Hsp15
MDKLNQRLDQWLWQVRIYKTRQIASKAIVSRNIKVNFNIISKTHYLIKVNDIIEISIDNKFRSLEVLKFTNRRISPKEVDMFYFDNGYIIDPNLEKSESSFKSKSNRIGKLNKKQRRIIQEFKERNIFVRDSNV